MTIKTLKKKLNGVEFRRSCLQLTIKIESLWFGVHLFYTKRIQILPIPPSFFHEVYWLAQSFNSQVGTKNHGFVTKAISSFHIIFNITPNTSTHEKWEI